MSIQTIIFKQTISHVISGDGQPSLESISITVSWPQCPDTVFSSWFVQ